MLVEMVTSMCGGSGTGIIIDISMTATHTATEAIRHAQPKANGRRHLAQGKSSNFMDAFSATYLRSILRQRKRRNK